MNTAVVNVKVDPRIKRQAQKTARDLGISLSAVVNHALRSFIQTRTVMFSDDIGLELTPWAKRMLARSEKDAKEGKVRSFTPDEMHMYLDKMIQNEEQGRSH